MVKLASKFNKICVLALVMTLIYFALPFQTFAVEDSTQRIIELKRQIEILTVQASQYKNNVLQKQKDADTLKRQIAILNNEVLKLETEIKITGKQIDATGIEINDLGGQIFDTQQKITNQKKALYEMIVDIDRRDRTNTLAMLINSKSLSDLTDQVHQTDDYSQKMNDLVESLKVQKAQLDIDKNKLTAKKSELERLKKEDEAQKDSLRTSKTSKDKLLKDTKGQETKYRQMLTAAEKKKATFFEELKKLEAEVYKAKNFIVHIVADSVPPAGTKIFKPPYENYKLTQGYGYTSFAKRGAYGGLPHSGADFVSGLGSPIHSIGPGKVVAVGAWAPGWGNWIAVQHDNNLVSAYAHMQAPSTVAVGTRVDNSSVIGYEGSTGNSTGSHVHISLYRDFFTYLTKGGILYFNYQIGTINPLDYIQL